MDFSFAVRSIGNTPLHDIKVSDDKCSPVSATPVTKAGGDQDALLEDGEVWTYTCTMTVPTHGAGEMDPLCNVVTATGSDEQDKPVSDTDRHCTDIIHPAIQVKKVADRATAQVGDTIGYRFDVTNPGDTGLTVTLSDARCDASTLKGPQKLAGDTDDLLEPDEQWRYTCTHKVTASDPDPLPNTVHVTGKDKIGGPSGTVEDEDSAVVDLIQPSPGRKPAPQQQVLAAQQQCAPRGRARLSGASGCVYRPFNATGQRPPDPPRHVLRGRAPDRHPQGQERPAHLQGPHPPQPPERRSAPGHRPRRVPNRIPDTRAHAGAELPALRPPGPVAPVHRLMRPWLLALPLVATALAVPATASADVRLSTERSVTRWAHTNLLAKVRAKPNRHSRAIARLRWQTEDGPPEVYVVLRSRRVGGATWMQIRVPGRPERPHRVGPPRRAQRPAQDPHRADDRPAHADRDADEARPGDLALARRHGRARHPDPEGPLLDPRAPARLRRLVRAVGVRDERLLERADRTGPAAA